MYQFLCWGYLIFNILGHLGDNLISPFASEAFIDVSKIVRSQHDTGQRMSFCIGLTDSLG